MKWDSTPLRVMQMQTYFENVATWRGKDKTSSCSSRKHVVRRTDISKLPQDVLSEEKENTHFMSKAKNFVLQ